MMPTFKKLNSKRKTQIAQKLKIGASEFCNKNNKFLIKVNNNNKFPKTEFLNFNISLIIEGFKNLYRTLIQGFPFNQNFNSNLTPIQNKGNQI